jgi:subtilisin family serine protease
MKVAGIHTYGQPRLGDVSVQAFFDINYRNRFWRFVNNRDLVTRIPPSYQHVGRLVHFDANGDVELPETEAATLEAEPPPCTTEQYDELRSEIKNYQTELRVQGRSERDAVLDATIEGRFPSLSDYRLESYLSAIQRQTRPAYVDSAVQLEMASRVANEALEASGGPTAPRRSYEELPVLIRLKRVGWTPPPGLEIGSSIGNLLSARGSADVLRLLELNPDVDRVELSRETGLPELVASVQSVGGDVVHRPPFAERGDQALVGIMDLGIDVLHEAFRNDQGLTRILGVWDQVNNIGPNPNALDANHFKGNYGTLYLADDINDFLGGIRPTPPGLRDPDGHGTHVASIAAGRATGGLADGMAPDAGIVVIITKIKTNPGDPFSVGYSASHLDGLAFLKAVSDGGTVVTAEPRPMAVNVSLGMNAGAHDGSSLLEASFDSITRQGQLPGFVIVKSAGNERGFGGHARFQAFHGQTDVHWESDIQFRLRDYIEVWYQAPDELTFVLTDPAGNASPTVSRTNSNVSQVLGGNLCQLVLEEWCKDNGDNRLRITITPQSTQIQRGIWNLSVTGVLVQSGTQIVDIWVERENSRPVRFTPEVAETTLSIPGTANTVITVAACHSSGPLRPIQESSFGPTRKGVPKPDIAAPGSRIIAAKGGDPDSRATIPKTGTSMAAPHVTGALALVLSCRHKRPASGPQHNAVQLRAAVTGTAKFRGLHNPAVGHGMLDCEALFRRLR